MTWERQRGHHCSGEKPDRGAISIGADARCPVFRGRRGVEPTLTDEAIGPFPRSNGHRTFAPASQRKPTRPWALIRMLCCPSRSPTSVSSRLPGETRRSSRASAASIRSKSRRAARGRGRASLEPGRRAKRRSASRPRKPRIMQRIMARRDQGIKRHAPDAQRQAQRTRPGPRGAESRTRAWPVSGFSCGVTQGGGCEGEPGMSIAPNSPRTRQDFVMSPLIHAPGDAGKPPDPNAPDPLGASMTSRKSGGINPPGPRDGPGCGARLGVDSSPGQDDSMSLHDLQ